jgi:hypothetical protein
MTSTWSSLIFVVSSIAYGFAFAVPFLSILKLICISVVIEFLMMGSIVASVTFLLTNRFMIQQESIHTVDKQVEWMYCFDGIA